MKPLLEHNERFARSYTPVPLGLPTAQVIIVTCLDHRLDPAKFLGLELGDAPVIRNAGGRITPAVIEDIAYLGFLAEQLAGGQTEADRLFEVAIVHHTECGTGFLADPGFRHQAATATGISEAALEAAAVSDPHVTVRADVERLLASPLLSPKVSVSGYVYDTATGRVTTAVDARFPQPVGGPRRLSRLPGDARHCASAGPGVRRAAGRGVSRGAGRGAGLGVRR
jgi:carbonic anhydrase